MKQSFILKVIQKLVHRAQQKLPLFKKLRVGILARSLNQFLHHFRYRLKTFLSLLIFFILLSYKIVKTEDSFDRAMGLQTKYAVYVGKKIDKDSLELFRHLFHQNKSLVETAKGAFQIPRIVHFIWLGPSSFPLKSVSNVRSWIAQNPHWKFIFWTDRPRQPPCNGMEVKVIKEYSFPFLGRCYASSQNWGEKSDLLRFEILFEYGGVYADHDANCLMPFDPYHQAYRFYCGLETPHPEVVGRSITAGNSIIGSCPGHPIIKRVIELIDERWDRLEEKYPGADGFSKTQIVMERTYITLTEALAQGLDKNSLNDIVFPAAYFFAKKGLKPVLSKHFFANSWASPLNSKNFEKEATQYLNKIEQRYSRLTLLQLSFLGINLICLIFGLVFMFKKRFT